MAYNCVTQLAVQIGLNEVMNEIAFIDLNNNV